MVEFKIPYTGKNFATGEDYKKIKSITQPEQVLPLRRIIDGLANGTILLDSRNLQYDIPEHEIDVVAGNTPTQTNANIAAATAADLAESADKFGENITARLNFMPEDAQETIDVVEAALSNVEGECEQAVAPQSKTADKQEPEALENNAADNGQS